MSETLTLPLSPGFARARKLSRIMTVLFSIGFWLTLLGAVLVLGTPFIPLRPGGHEVVGLNGFTVTLDGLSFAQRVWVLFAMETTVVPVVFLMHHTRRVFGYFAKGEIFVLPVIGDIRRAGVWLIISFFANIGGRIALNVASIRPGPADGTAWPLVIGVVTVIAAYVMEEGRRIAADHAEIV